jgi:hypothetical protein
MHIDFYLYILPVGVTVGIILFRRIEPPVLRWLVPFLAATLVVETIGLITSSRHLHNVWLYNPWNCIEFMFYSYLYSCLLEDPKWVRIIRYSLLVYPLLFLYNVLTVGTDYFHRITFQTGSVLVIFWSYLYFRQFMRSPGHISVFRNPAFWLSTGLILFYTGFFFYVSASQQLATIIPRWIWQAIIDPLNILLYGSFLIALLCRPMMTKTS